MKRIVLCADDFAVHAQATDAIVDLARSGRISATSAMVLSPRWAQDAQRLLELRGQIDVGLHLDWSSDFALRQGHGRSLAAAMARAAFGGFDQAVAAAVVERQLDAFEAQWKAAPDHVDGHQHVQQFDGIRQALVSVLQRRYGVPRPYLRISRIHAAGLALKSRVITWLGASELGRLAAPASVPCAAVLCGSYGFDADPSRYAQLMNRWLQQAPEGAILMCHPAHAGALADPVAAARAVELAYLGGPAFGAALLHHGVLLSRGASLFSSVA